MREEIQSFVRLGPLPDVNAPEEVIARHQRALERIRAPVTDSEASALVHCFGPDDCYGLAWTLLHLIETAPGGAPLPSAPGEQDNEWRLRLWKRAHRDDA